MLFSYKGFTVLIMVYDEVLIFFSGKRVQQIKSRGFAMIGFIGVIETLLSIRDTDKAFSPKAIF